MGKTTDAPNAVTIAGFDPTGGAGILADGDTFRTFGYRSCAALTGRIPQTWNQVFGVYPSPLPIFRDELSALNKLSNLATIKVGAIPNDELFRPIRDFLQNHSSLPSVVDPVIWASAGPSLFPLEKADEFIDVVGSKATLLTPNRKEVFFLAHLSEKEESEKAGYLLLEKGVKNILIKSARQDEEKVSDLLISTQLSNPIWLETPRRHLPMPHGSGCRLSSAIAAFLGKGDSLVDSILKAREWFGALLKNDLPTLSGRRVFAIGRRSIGRFHALVPNAELAKAAMNEGTGADVIQLRNKELDDRDLLREALTIRKWSREYGCQFIVNDRVDIAQASHADGVHIGPHDLPLSSARAILGNDFLIGCSVDNPEEAKEAEKAGADYLGAGPLYPTTSKLDAGPVIGIKKLEAIVRAVEIPVIAIGGITLERLEDVIRTGVHGMAILSAITAAPSPQNAAAEIYRRLHETKSLVV